ncbi:MAG: DNA polymerase III subunit gamma/tau [Candidatus Obscuribacterales bacterium]|nr:DNA polymerase III subunit gamma/tau [Candidatus Obscuribacterales bacterium]
MSESLFKRHEPLYSKYRPQSLGELVGQEGVKRTLVNAIEHNRLSHAYLFTGPRGTGKTSTARILAKSINCKSIGRPTVEPCQSCSCCIEIAQGSSPAVFEIDAASNNSVDDARVLIERAPLKAVGGQFKVYIIDECHMLTKEAFNALLKTIEEPPEGVFFILATTEEHKVLPTIISRCQRLMFKLIEQDSLRAHLRNVADKENIEIEDEALQLIARRSGGGLRDALSNLDQASLLSAPGSPATISDLLRLLGALHEDVLLDISSQIAERSGQAVIASVNKLLSEGREPQVVLQELSRHFLSLMKASYLGSAEQLDGLKAVVLGSESYLKGLIEQGSLFERSELSQIVEQLDRLEQTCRRSSQPAIHLEIGLLGLCHRHDVYLLKDLQARVQLLEERLSGEPDLSQSRAYHAPPAPASRSLQHQEAPARSLSPASQNTAAPHSSGRPVSDASFDNRVSPAANSAPVNSAPAAEAVPSPQSELESESSVPQASREESARELAPAAHDLGASELNSDIDYVWQQILDELQRRHLPTFSLASTHAFPLSISARELNIGVMKEGFQKMLESKVEHLRAAAQAVTSTEIIVKIRVADNQASPKKAQAPASRPAAPARTESQFPERSNSAPSPAGQNESATAPVRIDDALDRADAPAEAPTSSSASASGEFDSSMVKEAYKLFEGPGSRTIR